MKKLSKKFKASLEKIGDKKGKELTIEEAIGFAIDTANTKFDSTVEVHVNLNVNVKHADQMVRGTIILPHGTGKKIVVAAFVHEENKKKALDAGADLAGLDTLSEEVLKGNINFSIAVATPDTMKEIGKLAKILGPKGLMPSPKAGTVTPNFESAIKELKKGKIEYKTDKAGIIHNGIGKVSFGKDKIVENFKTLLGAILEAKPVSIKGKYLISVDIATTMGPGLRIALSDVNEKCK